MATAKANNAASAARAINTDWMRALSIALAVLGILVAGYMTWAELTSNETACLDTGKIDCSAVQNSAYAKILGIPVALLGLVGYVAILSVLVAEDLHPLAAAYGRTLVIGMALFGVIFQAYLTVIEATVLDAWCQWCVASFVIITSLLVIGGLRLNQFLQPLKK